MKIGAKIEINNKEYDDITCPFCKEVIESVVEENKLSDFDEDYFDE